METKQIQTNVFTDGLNTDLHPLTTPNTMLTDCINGTILTYNGNEHVLQNDFGNVKLNNITLKPDFIPIGLKEYNGVLYLILYNPFTNETEIGSYPSVTTSSSDKIYEISEVFEESFTSKDIVTSKDDLENVTIKKVYHQLTPGYTINTDINVNYGDILTINSANYPKIYNIEYYVNGRQIFLNKNKLYITNSGNLKVKSSIPPIYVIENGLQILNGSARWELKKVDETANSDLSSVDKIAPSFQGYISLEIPSNFTINEFNSLYKVLVEITISNRDLNDDWITGVTREFYFTNNSSSSKYMLSVKPDFIWSIDFDIIKLDYTILLEYDSDRRIPIFITNEYYQVKASI